MWRRQWHPAPVLLPGKSHGWRSLVGYSPQGRRELDTTERLHLIFLDNNLRLHQRHRRTGKPGVLQSTGSQRVRYNSVIWTTTAAPRVCPTPLIHRLPLCYPQTFTGKLSFPLQLGQILATPLGPWTHPVRGNRPLLWPHCFLTCLTFSL